MVGLGHEKTYGILFLCTVMLVFQGLVTYFFLKLPAGQGNAKVSLSRKLYIENAKKEENRRSKMLSVLASEPNRICSPGVSKLLYDWYGVSLRLECSNENVKRFWRRWRESSDTAVPGSRVRDSTGQTNDGHK